MLRHRHVKIAALAENEVPRMCLMKISFRVRLKTLFIYVLYEIDGNTSPLSRQSLFYIFPISFICIRVCNDDSFQIRNKKGLLFF